MLRIPRRLRALILPFSCALFALALGATSEAAPPAPAPNGEVRITVDARQVPLGRLMKQFAALAHVEDVTIDPSLENILVSVKLDAVTAAEAFRAALADAGAEFAIAGTGPELRVVAHGVARHAARPDASSPGRPVKGTIESAEADAMLAVMKGQDAVAQAENSVAPEAQDAPEAPESHADPVAAFLGRGGAPEAPAAAPTPSVSSPAQAAPLMMPTSILGNGSAGASKPAAAATSPADLPTDPFARYLTVMSATTPPKPPKQQ
jgi:hypothetical protein